MGPIAPQLSAPNYNAIEQKKGYGCFCAICGHDSLGLSWLRLTPSRNRHQPALRTEAIPLPSSSANPKLPHHWWEGEGEGLSQLRYSNVRRNPCCTTWTLSYFAARRRRHRGGGGGGGGCADGRTPLFCAADLAAAFHPPSIPPVPSRLRRTAARVSVKQKSICAEKVSSLEPTLPAEDVERPGLNPGGRPGGCQPRKVLRVWSRLAPDRTAHHQNTADLISTRGVERRKEVSVSKAESSSFPCCCCCFRRRRI